MELDTSERLQVLEHIVAALARAVGMPKDAYLGIVEDAAKSVWEEREDDDTTH